jgi:DNA-binding NarL/FixJ family response regulator
MRKGADEIMQPQERLTAKDLQVAALVWQGLTNREIARTIGTTEQVMKNYLRNTFDKLGFGSRPGTGLSALLLTAAPVAGRNRRTRQRFAPGERWPAPV